MLLKCGHKNSDPGYHETCFRCALCNANGLFRPSVCKFCIETFAKATEEPPTPFTKASQTAFLGWAKKFAHRKKKSSSDRNEIYFSQEDLNKFTIDWYKSGKEFSVGNCNQEDSMTSTPQRQSGQIEDLSSSMVEIPNSLPAYSQLQDLNDLQTTFPIDSSSLIPPAQQGNQSNEACEYVDISTNISALISESVSNQLQPIQNQIALMSKVLEKLSENDDNKKYGRDNNLLQTVTERTIDNQNNMVQEVNATVSSSVDEEEADGEWVDIERMEDDDVQVSLHENSESENPLMTVDSPENWYKIPFPHQLLGDPPILHWGGQSFTSLDIQIKEVHGSKLFKALNYNTKVLNLCRNSVQTVLTKEKPLRQLSKMEVLLNPMKCKEASSNCNWKILDDGKIDITLSEELKKMCIKPNKKFDDDEDDNQLLGPLKQKFVSSDTYSATVVKSLQVGQWPLESMVPEGPLAKACSKVSAEGLNREVRRRKILWSHIQATEALDVMTNLLKPDLLSKFTSTADMASHVSSIAGSLEVIKELLRPSTLFFYENWANYKKELRQKTLENVRPESLVQHAVTMDVFSKGLWSSDQLQDIKEKSEKCLEQKSLQYKRKANNQSYRQEGSIGSSQFVNHNKKFRPNFQTFQARPNSTPKRGLGRIQRGRGRRGASSSSHSSHQNDQSANISYKGNVGPFQRSSYRGQKRGRF